jgi:acyl carrier protein
MTADEATAIILEAIGRVAPEIDSTSIDPRGELQLEADLDSMDFLHVVETVSSVIGRDIAERDYPQIATLAGFTHYLVENSAG